MTHFPRQFTAAPEFERAALRAGAMAGNFVLVMCSFAGCSTESAKPQPTAPESDHHAATDPHREHGAVAGGGDSQLIISTAPPEVAAGEPVQLRLMIHAADGTMVREFETIHEKKVHLIIVRDDLGEFAHIHPEIDGAGNLSAQFTFPTAGRYLLYADHKPNGQAQSTTRGELRVAGETPAATALEPNVPGQVSGEGLSATISINRTAAETEIAFDLVDLSGRPVDDLEAYLGAMGHLVILSDDGKEYVHAHPLEDRSGNAGRVRFAAHFMKPGLYKGWGQFQRDGTVQTVPFVLENK